MAFSSRTDWLVPALLLAPALIPLIVAVLRIVTLTTGVEFVPDESGNYAAMPLPIGAHVVGAVLYGFIAPFQFAPGIRRRFPRFHKYSGRVVAPAGIVLALSGMWMASFYEGMNSAVLYGFRMVFGTLMAAFIVVGVVAILRRHVAAHRAFMIRGFSVFFGTSMQSLVFLPLLIAGVEPTELQSDLMMGGCWVVSLAAAEWIIRGHPLPRLMQAV